MLSTLQPLLGTTKDDGKKKPTLYKLYDFTKGGTDVVDQKVDAYSVKLKSKGWALAAFSYILYTVRVTACSLVALNTNQDPGKMDSFQFGYDMFYSLLLPRIQQRPRICLKSAILRKIVMATGEEIKETAAQVPVEGLTYPPIAQEANKCKV